MASSRAVNHTHEHMLRVLHCHLQRKRTGLFELNRMIEDLQHIGSLSDDVALSLSTQIRSLLGSDNDLTDVERTILDRDLRYQTILHERYPILSSTLLLVCVCTIDGLTTKEIASIIGRSEKSIDYYRQKIRTIIGVKGTHQALRNALTQIVS